MENKVLSVVIPLLNEQDNLLPLYEELQDTVKKLQFFTSYEFVFVDDGSTDRSLQILKQLAIHDSCIKILSFTRNFGHEYATYAGIINATGDAVVLIDADRQDPPALIVEFEKAYRAGFDIVYGYRIKRLNETRLKKITSKAFYPIFSLITGVDLPRNVGDFCMLSKTTIAKIKQLSENTIFMRGLIYWTGLPKKGIPFVRLPRQAGTSKYNYPKLPIFALENIISFSTVPIYLILFSSIFIMILCLLGTITALLMRISGYVVMTGWTSIMICMLFLFAATIFFIGIIGLYVGKIFQEVKRRPLFLIKEKINFEQLTTLSPLETMKDSYEKHSNLPG